MISSDHISKICAEYGIGESVNLEKALEGVLNHNYIIETSKGKYFIKSVREKKKKHLQYIYNVEAFMGSMGISAVIMLKTQDGKIFIELDGEVYTLYKYIESDRSHVYSLEEYKNMGALLAKIHEAGAQAPEIFSEKQMKVLSRTLAMERYEKWKGELLAKPELTDPEQLFLKYINLKLEWVPKFPHIEECPNPTLIHGDFHAGNLLMDKETRQIVGVCDWEQALMAPRGYEVARSIMYICFYDNFKVETALETSKAFLSGYNSVLPISAEELKKGFDMRVDRLLTGSWLEEGFFDRGDSRGNKFIQGEMDLINFFTKDTFNVGIFY